MQKRRLLLTVIIIVVMFATYLWIQPTGSGYRELVSGSYDLLFAAKLAIKVMLIPALWGFLTFFLATRRHLSVAVSAYLVFLTLVVGDKISFGALGFRQLYAYSTLSMGMAFTFVWIYQELYWARRFKLATIFSFVAAAAVYALPASYVVYYLNFDEVLDKTALFAVFQTNTTEAIEYWSDFISVKWSLLYMACIFALALLMFTHEKRKEIKLDRSLLIFIVGFFAISTASTATSLRLPHHAFNAAIEYHHELSAFKKIQKRRASGERPVYARKQQTDEVHVVIIGESLNKRHMGLYGYIRDTTPLLSRLDQHGEIVVYQNAFSNHTHTMPVLSQALTEANQFTDKNYYESASIIDVLNSAAVATVWITNQNLMGAWDNMVSVLAHSADVVIGINKAIGKTTQSQSMDGDLLPHVAKSIRQHADTSTVIFVHLMGNHGRYCSRFGDDYAVFNEPLSRGIFGRAVSEKGAAFNNSLNCYDNSVLYNDYIVSSIIAQLSERGGVSSATYIADHGDDVIAQLGHNSAKFTFEMTNIPLLFWMSDGYRDRYPEKSEALAEGVKRLFSNDLLYDTLLGLMDVKTDLYEAKFDLTSKGYSIDHDETYTLHGRQLLTANDNYLWWQRHNLQTLQSIKQDTRVIPHRVNSLGKLHDVWATGYRSFEVDILFEHSDTDFFLIGHEAATSGERFDDFLNSVPVEQIQKIWFDLKNLNDGNYHDVLDALEKLDSQYALKDRIILESGTRQPWFKMFRDKGWHTSYYAPTERIIELLKNDDVTGMEDLAHAMAGQVHGQNVAAVSFDHRAYPFIKQYLEQRLAPSIVYHSWMGPSIANGAFMAALKQTPTYRDSRVKTVLVSFKSPFHL